MARLPPTRPHRPKVEYDEHEGSVGEMAERLGIKLNLTSLGKSEGLTADEAKK